MKILEAEMALKSDEIIGLNKNLDDIEEAIESARELLGEHWLRFERKEPWGKIDDKWGKDLKNCMEDVARLAEKLSGELSDALWARKP